MRVMVKRVVMVVALTALGVCCASALFAGKYVTLCFEAEDAQGVTGKVWSVAKKATDKFHMEVSGKKVLAVPFYEQGEKPPRNEATYTVKVPTAGVYYLWARTIWANGCGNSFYIKVQGYDSGDWIIGGDGTYDHVHWICLTDGGNNNDKPRPLALKQGQVTFTVGSKESATMLDQFVLTNDRKYTPANAEKPTPDTLVKDETKDK